MRILYISCDPGIPLNGRKGCSTHVRETCVSLQKAGHQVLVAIPFIGEDKFFSTPLNFVNLPLFCSKKLGFDIRLYLNNFYQWFTLKSIVKEFKPQAIYERYSLYSWVGSRIEKVFKIPRVIEINAPLAMQHRDRLRFPKIAQKFEEKILKSADAVIAISKPLKEYLVKIGVQESKITVMPIAVDPNLFNPLTDGNDIKKQLKIENKTIFGYVGALNYYHGIDNLFLIADYFKRKKMSAVVLVIGGEKKKIEKQKGKIKNLNLEDYIIFLGSVPYESLPKHIAVMDITIVSGHTPYASPTKLFEYAAMEKPIIAPDYIPIRAILDQGEESKYFIFDSNDIESLFEKIDHLYYHPEFRQILVKKIKNIVLQNHTWESNTEKVTKILEGLQSS